MTLRELGASFVQYWQEYYLEVTTKNVLDWSIGNILLSAFFGFLGLILVGFVFGAIAVLWEKISGAWERAGLPYLWVRLDKRFGVYVSGLIMVGGTILFLALVGVLLAFVDMAMQ